MNTVRIGLISDPHAPERLAKLPPIIFDVLWQEIEKEDIPNETRERLGDVILLSR